MTTRKNSPKPSAKPARTTSTSSAPEAVDSVSTEPTGVPVRLHKVHTGGLLAISPALEAELGPAAIADLTELLETNSLVGVVQCPGRVFNLRLRVLLIPYDLELDEATPTEGEPESTAKA